MSTNAPDLQPGPDNPAPSGLPTTVVLAVVGLGTILFASAFLAYIVWQHPRAAVPVQVATACISVGASGLIMLIAWITRR